MPQTDAIDRFKRDATLDELIAVLHRRHRRQPPGRGARPVAHLLHEEIRPPARRARRGMGPVRAAAQDPLGLANVELTFVQ